MIRIEHLYVSPGHNYFGHHGQPAGEHPILSVSEIECVAGHGIRGDRYFDYKPDYKGQITFFAAEIYDELCATFLPLAGTHPEPSAFRRNVITRGIDLNTLIGQQFTIQGITFLGTAECSPCHWMDQAFAPRAHAALKDHGGLRAKILTDGWLRVSPASSISTHA
ncbi:MOSC domain-containing protein [Rariglobus hedericola]|uniref:Molybdenum cofactor biosysynthesis protein n=1 Tax=Rariglobus hedericola TaxID=2597822 RepID=A0A556QQA0_9BACT|nr:molybdenum cofactor biosysynthesis protein [Rariglobus hedericola]TSJ78827.1 molybdenum cofactor biosysynthesis protein [Rariglobus hedericola]